MLLPGFSIGEPNSEESARAAFGDHATKTASASEGDSLAALWIKTVMRVAVGFSE